MTTTRGFVVVGGVVVGVLVRIAFSLSSLSSSLSLSSSSSWMISPNFRSGEMRLRDDDDVRDDEEEENKSTSFCATISATGPQYATSISKRVAFVVVSIIVN
jgi:hypothetical protein